jgi:coenzyme F420 hydrogenase subunit beta
MNQVSPALRRILKADCCTGCGACASVSGGVITMAMTPAGVLRPQAVGPLPDATDGIISDICPGVRLAQTSREGNDHPLWGPLIAVRTGAATDPDLRHHASSGGALSALLVYLLDTGSVDRIVQVAASTASPIENATVETVCAEGVRRAAGSRYGPSAPLADLDRQLASPGRFALVGKPCDIAAARALARHDARVAEKVPVMLSFFCAGVPSLHGTQAILDRLKVDAGALATFRYRGDGWPGRCTAMLSDNASASMSYAESWGDILSKHVQFRCKICADGVGGLADVVCADAWDCDEAGYPLFAEAEGLSLVLSRTEKGEALVAAAAEAGRLAVEPLDPARIRSMQPSQAFRKRNLAARLAALAVLRRPRPDYRGFHLLALARHGRPRTVLRNFPRNPAPRRHSAAIAALNAHPSQNIVKSFPPGRWTGVFGGKYWGRPRVRSASFGETMMSASASDGSRAGRNGRSPRLTGTGRVGAPLCVVLGADLSPDRLLWCRDGVPIPGANGIEYVPGEEDDRAEITCRLVLGRPQSREPAPARHPRSAAGGRVALGRGLRSLGRRGILPAAQSFSGEALHFGVMGARAHIDPVTGALAIPTDLPLAGEPVRVTAQNSGGSAALEFLVTVEAEGSAVSLARPGRCSSITNRGSDATPERPKPPRARRFRRVPIPAR